MAAALMALATLGAACGSAPTPGNGPGKLVALGDSFTANSTLLPTTSAANASDVRGYERDLARYAAELPRTNDPQVLREALAVTPPERILLETDAPYLTPHPYRGRPNSPAMAAFTLRRMADELGLDVAALAAQVAANTEAVYGPW